MQVEAVAERLKEIDSGVIQLISSGMNRTMESAEIIGEILGVQPEVNAGFNQYSFGFGPNTSGEEALSLRNEPEGRIVDWRPYPTGETVGEMYRRVGNAMTGVLQSQEHMVVIVSHSYTIDKILNWWIGTPEDVIRSLVFYTAQASISYMGYTPSNDRGLYYVSETRHLPLSLLSV